VEGGTYEEGGGPERPRDTAGREGGVVVVRDE
jgi:hypothetical protein